MEDQKMQDLRMQDQCRHMEMQNLKMKDQIRRSYVKAARALCANCF